MNTDESVLPQAGGICPNLAYSTRPDNSRAASDLELVTEHVTARGSPWKKIVSLYAEHDLEWELQKSKERAS
jgi:hypothetical protein